MIDRSDAVNLAHNIAEHACRLVSERGAKCLADAVLEMDEYIRSIEADQRDAERYRWWRSKWSANTDEAMDELNDALREASDAGEIDDAIDVAIRQSATEEGNG